MGSRTLRQDDLDMSQAPPVRTSSFSSDVMSNSAKSAGATHQVPPVNPQPAFIAQSEASDLISNELDRKVLVSHPALTLLNEFLDHVLYSIISTSHSVGLSQLKTAVPIVLKPRLGKAALRVAEEELKEYIDEDEAEELHANGTALQTKYDFDTDLVWKLARLRCMVYARMGDLEEEDEEEWLEKEHLLDQAAAAPIAARQSMAITPGSAIFLTSVIEYLGEQALYYAAQYAQKRHNSSSVEDGDTTTPESQLSARHAELVLDGKDMNHVGRDSPLSRLWRAWRRNTRSPTDTSERGISPEAVFSPTAASYYSRATSDGAATTIPPIIEEHNRSLTKTPVPYSPSQIPLPMSDNDIAQIEGWFYDSDDPATSGRKRHLSLPIIPEPNLEDLTAAPQPILPERSPLRPTFERHRSQSLPYVLSPFQFPIFGYYDGNPVVPHQPEDSRHEAARPDEQIGSQYIQAGKPADHIHSEAHPAQTDRNPPTPNRPRTAQSSEQLNATVGVLAGALGAVGVHHVGEDIHDLDTERANKRMPATASPTEQPLTSASIRGPVDFDMMYVPEGRDSPEETRPKAEKAVGAEPNEIPPHDPYEEMRLHQLEQHRRYSEEMRSRQLEQHRRHSEEVRSHQLEQHRRYSESAHEMDTPSIYTHQEYAPRFPEDMRSTASSRNSRRSSIDQTAEAIPRSIPITTPRTATAQRLSTKINPALAAVSRGYESDTESPISPASSRRTHSRASHKTTRVTPDPVPELPRTQIKAQPSVDEHGSGAARFRGHSASSSSSSRLLGFTRDAAGRPQTIHQQRAAGDMTEDDRRAHSSTPNGGNQGRPGTANSATSARKSHLRIRGDSENNIKGSTSYGENTKRSLELLINSDETLLYTLTPSTANFREDDIRSASANQSPRRMAGQEPAGYAHSTTGSRQGLPSKRTSHATKPSNESARSQISATQARQGPVPSVKNMVVPKSPAPRAKNPMGEPRDAKVERMGGVRDLADYMRSTGPETDDQLPRALVGGGGATARAATQPTAQSRTQPVIPVIMTTNRADNRLRFQARDARPSRHAESSDLIDFIREGPPRQQGDHRINRHIAPFRTTMDSDDLNHLASSLPKNSSDTNGISSAANSTLNSNTPLVSHAARMDNSSRAPVSDNEPPMPQKTRRRVKDPYALDESDDELFADNAPKPQTNEESLIDFLRNTAPPASMTAQPILAAKPQQSSSVKRTPSMSSMSSMDRFKHIMKGPLAPDLDPSPDRTTQFQRDTSRTTQLQGETSRVRAESPHLTQSGSKRDSYRPTKVTHAAHVDRNRANKAVERSDSRASRNSTINDSRPQSGYGVTADLAHYLKNTGPPPGSQQAPQPFILTSKQVTGAKAQEKEGGFKKFFSMRRK